MKTLMMLVGPSYCGKSSFAEMVKKLAPEKVEIFSSDAIREEIYGDAGCQDNPAKVFEILHERIIKCLKEKEDVVAIYDATNLSAKRRRSFLNSIRTIACYRACIAFPVSLDELLARVPLRDRKVPEEVLIKQIKNFQCPQKCEGWDDIVIELQGEGYNDRELMEKCVGFDQKSKHHTLDLYDHMKETANVVSSKNFIKFDVSRPEVVDDAYKILLAAYFHDIGKLITQEIDENGEAHYRNHHNASTYMWLCMKGTKKLLEDEKFTQQDLLDVAFLIQNHMEFYFRDKTGLKRLQESTTPTLYESLKAIHAADVAAHVKQPIKSENS
jgi:predicted kinase